MSYKVVCKFADLQDGNHVYDIGDEYPRKGVEVSEDRIKELASVNNKMRKALIEKVAKIEAEPEVVDEVDEEAPKPKKTAKKAKED